MIIRFTARTLLITEKLNMINTGPAMLDGRCSTPINAHYQRNLVVSEMDGKVGQFVAITGATRDVAKRLLEACGGNLDLAVNMHLESGGNAGSSNEMDTTNNILSPKSYEEMYGIRAPIPQTRGVLVEEDTPPRRVLRSRRLPQTVFDPFQDYSKAVAGSSRKLPGPGNDAKKKSLAELFQPPHDIMFHGSFHEARLAGEHRRKWLLVNVQDSKEFASQVLNRDVWSNHNVKDIVREYFVFWQIHRITDDGIKFKQLYHVDNYPYIAVIDPRTGENMVHWNSMSASEFAKVIQEFLSTHCYDDGDHEPLNSRKSSVVELSEQSQLEAAIQASLQDCQASANAVNRSSKYELVFSESESDENDVISLSSDARSDVDETDGSWMGTTDVDLHSDSDIQAHTSCKGVESSVVADSSVVVSIDADSEVRMKPVNIHDNDPLLQRYSEESRPKQTMTRKRNSSQTSLESEHPRKVLRASTSKMSECSSGRLQRVKSKRSRDPMAKQSPKKNIEQSRTSTTVNDANSVEELLKSGFIGNHEVSHILFRLPDGSRLQKAFICSRPIKELFDFLIKQGLDMSEHEVVTHFPRRNISEISLSTTFKKSGLYPRETVFVNTAE